MGKSDFINGAVFYCSEYPYLHTRHTVILKKINTILSSLDA